MDQPGLVLQARLVTAVLAGHLVQREPPVGLDAHGGLAHDVATDPHLVARLVDDPEPVQEREVAVVELGLEGGRLPGPGAARDRLAHRQAQRQRLLRHPGEGLAVDPHDLVPVHVQQPSPPEAELREHAPGHVGVDALPDVELPGALPAPPRAPRPDHADPRVLAEQCENLVLLVVGGRVEEHHEVVDPTGEVALDVAPHVVGAVLDGADREQRGLAARDLRAGLHAPHPSGGHQPRRHQRGRRVEPRSSPAARARSIATTSSGSRSGGGVVSGAGSSGPATTGSRSSTGPWTT